MYACFAWWLAQSAIHAPLSTCTRVIRTQLSGFVFAQGSFRVGHMQAVSQLVLWRIATPWLPQALGAHDIFLLSMRASPSSLRLVVADDRYRQGVRATAEEVASHQHGRYQSRSPWAQLDPARTGTATDRVPLTTVLENQPHGRVWPEEAFESGYVYIGEPPPAGTCGAACVRALSCMLVCVFVQLACLFACLLCLFGLLIVLLLFSL